MLNDRGVPNPTEYKRLHGLRYKQPTRKNSTLWKYFAISDMLCNEMYIGNMVQGKYGSVSYKTKQNKPRPKDEWYRVEGTHEAILSEQDYLDLSKDFVTQKERLEKLVADTQKQLDTLERKMEDGDNRRQLIEQYTNLEHLDREIVEKLIDYILVGKKDPVTKEVPIEIHWNF